MPLRFVLVEAERFDYWDEPHLSRACFNQVSAFLGLRFSAEGCITRTAKESVREMN